MTTGKDQQNKRTVVAGSQRFLGTFTAAFLVFQPPDVGTAIRLAAR